MRNVVMLALLASGSVAAAQSAVPVPAQFASAKTAFLSFAGAPANTDIQREQTRVLYGSLYRSLQSTGRYTLLSAPAQAELCMEFAIVENADFYGFRLAVRDCRLNALLWTLDEAVRPAVRSASIQKNIDGATEQLLLDLNTLAAGKAPGALQDKNRKAD